MLFQHLFKVLEMPTPSAEAAQSTSYGLSGARDGKSQSFRVWFDLEQSGGEGSPGARVRLQTSWDKTHWLTAVESSRLSGDGRLSEWKAVEALGPFVRAETTLEGVTLPEHRATVVLLSHADFQLRT